MYSSSCPEGECTEEMTIERIIGNPIYNYQLLKRITVYWDNVEQAIGKVDKKGTLTRMKKLKSQHGKLPTEDDLKSAAKAMNKLQDVYSLSPSQLVTGIIGNMSHIRSTHQPYYSQEKYPRAPSYPWLILITLQGWLQ